MPYIDSNGTSIYYEEEGTGPPLLMAHSFAMSLQIHRFFGYVDALKDSYRCILIDLRGHGKSGKPHDPASYDRHIMAGDILAVMDHLGIERFHYLGYSLGTRVGFYLARRAPERLISMLLGGEHPYRLDLSYFRRLMNIGPDGLDPEVLADFRPTTPGLGTPPQANDREALKAIVAYDLPDISADVLGKMTMPCLVFAGENDKWGGTEARECVKQMPNSRLAILPGLNHFEGYARIDMVLPHFQEFFKSINRK